MADESLICAVSYSDRGQISIDLVAKQSGARPNADFGALTRCVSEAAQRAASAKNVHTLSVSAYLVTKAVLDTRTQTPTPARQGKGFEEHPTSVSNRRRILTKYYEAAYDGLSEYQRDAKMQGDARFETDEGTPYRMTTVTARVLR